MTKQDFHDKIFLLVQDYIDECEDLKDLQGKTIVEKDCCFDVNDTQINIEEIEV